MTTHQQKFRAFAPSVLALSLLFLLVSDARASCLAAWLCEPPATEDCRGEHSAGSAWEPSSGPCSFEPLVDRVSQKLDAVQLHVVHDELTGAFAVSMPLRFWHIHTKLSGTLSHAPPPFYELHASYLI